ncbi:MAG: GAF domain-containing protein, partial [Nitrososphaerales archaeon]
MEEIITPSQAAALLQIHVRTVHRLAEKGTIPGNKIGRSWRFSKRNILDLASTKQRKGDISERKRAEEGIQRRVQELTALHDISMSVTSTLDLRTVLDTLLEKIDLLLPYSVTTLRLINKETGLLEAVAARNVDEEEWKATMREGGRGFSKGALENKGPVIIGNVQKNTEAKYPEFLRKYGLVSYLGLPLVAKGETLGTLGFYTKEEHQFTSEEIQFLSTLAGQAAIAMHNSQLYEQVERRTHELSALYAVTATASKSLDLDHVLHEVIQKITEIFHFDATRIFLFNTQMDELHLRASFETHPEFFTRARVFRPGQGNVGRVAETGEPLIFENIQSDPRYQKLSYTKTTEKGEFSFISVFPIKSKLRTLGTIVCIGKDPRRLTPGEIQLITSMAGQIGVAVENAHLFEETKARAKHLSALYSIAAVVNQSLDIGVVSHSVMEKILEIFDFDAARIYLFDEETKELRLLAHQGFFQDAIPTDSYKPGQGILGKVFEAVEPILFEDIQTDPEFQRMVYKGTALRGGFRGSFGIPIIAKGKKLGVINFVSKSVHRFSSNEIQLIHSIADHIGVALENAHLYEQSKKQAAELEKEITERKLAEEQLVQAAKLGALG